MKRFSSLILTALIAAAPLTAVVSTVTLSSGCATLQGDPVVIRAEQGIKVAFDTIDTFLAYEHTANATGAIGWDVREVAEKLRREAPKWIESAHIMVKAYKDNRTVENKANLLTALAVLQAGAVVATDQLLETKKP